MKSFEENEKEKIAQFQIMCKNRLKHFPKLKKGNGLKWKKISEYKPNSFELKDNGFRFWYNVNLRGSLRILKNYVTLAGVTMLQAEISTLLILSSAFSAQFYEN